jgi:hypothetical protein
MKVEFNWRAWLSKLLHSSWIAPIHKWTTIVSGCLLMLAVVITDIGHRYGRDIEVVWQTLSGQVLLACAIIYLIKYAVRVERGRMVAPPPKARIYAHRFVRYNRAAVDTHGRVPPSPGQVSASAQTVIVKASD